MIRVESVAKRFGRLVAVDNVSVNIPAGDSVALWGGNGAGKTTLIRCVLGLLNFEGRIQVGGHDVRRQGKLARMQIGYVPQELGFYDDLGVSEAVVFFARLKGLTLRTTDGVLASVGLEGHGRKRIRELSGGMKQRLALAIARLGDPPVLVLDEVTASLDACGRRDFVSMLTRLSGAGRTMLFASHRIEEVASLAKRVVMLENGKVSAVLDTAEFVSRSCPGSVLHMTLRPVVRNQAVTLLRESGFTATLNGVGILVPVENEQKAVPFRLLADARITVDDFELIPAAQLGTGGTTGHAESEIHP
ncbi:MAG: ABC transporter ATP-binding protein [Planctomycetes bacterium]|nr:ABC transporter ATP-binding protein [Planctomycetota bacterium]